MPFLIQVPKAYSSDEFTNFLLAKYINDVSSRLSRSAYRGTESFVKKYLDSSESNLNGYSIINYYIRRFAVSEPADDGCVYIGDLGSRERVIGSDRKISDVVRLLEYGTSTTPAIPRIVTVMNNIQSNLDDIYREWAENNSERRGRR